MLRMSPNFHQASSGTRAGVRSPSTSVALVERPLEPAECLQALGQDRAQLQEMGDVALRVGDLAFADRSDQPVRQAVGLGKRPAEHLVDQTGERGRRHAQEAGDDLGVEDGGGDGAARRLQHVEVLERCVGDRRAGSAEEGGQWFGVYGERVDQRHLVRPGDLDERQVGDVRALRVELGVEGVVLLAGDRGDELVEAGAVDHHDRRRASRRCACHGAPSARRRQRMVGRDDDCEPRFTGCMPGRVRR